MTRPQPDRPPPFTKAQRLHVFETYGAIVCCQGAGCDSAIYIRGAHIDHTQAWIDDGEHDISNWAPLCLPCHKAKTAREVRNNAKAKRVAAKHSGETTPKRREWPPGSLRRRVSPEWPSRKMQSRGFIKKVEAAE